jgi:hypothetical protein
VDHPRASSPAPATTRGSGQRVPKAASGAALHSPPRIYPRRATKLGYLATVRIGSGSARVWPQAPRAPALTKTVRSLVGSVIVGGLSARRRDVRPPRWLTSKPGNGDAACGNGAALHPERTLPMRAQVGPWASVGFNLGRISPLRIWGGRGEFPKDSPSEPLPQSQRGDGGDHVAHVAEAAGPPHVDSHPNGGERSRGVRMEGAAPKLDYLRVVPTLSGSSIFL